MKALPTVDNLDSTAIQVFGTASDKRAAKLKQSVQYYLNGTKDGFLRYRPHPTGTNLKFTRYVMTVVVFFYLRLNCKWSMPKEAP